jgi:adenylate cyclase class 2
MIETEVKLAISDPAAFKDRLRKLGWRIAVRRQEEKNMVYDYPNQTLFKSSRLLRLRQVGKRGWMTVKGPPHKGTAHKVRDEYEIETHQIDILSKMLETLGYELLWRYEKFRAVYKSDAESGLVFVDETPIGNFVELEGEAGWIDRMARKLGFSPSDYITASYRELFAAYQRQHPEIGRHMVFPKARP